MKNSREKIVVYVDSDLKGIIPRFLEIRQENIRDIAEAINAGDYENMLRIGHSMRGAGTGYGFDYITELGASIERAARMKDLKEIRRCLEKLTVYLENVEIRYR